MHGNTIKMGAYSGGNDARDFMRGVRPPVASWVLLSTTLVLYTSELLGFSWRVPGSNTYMYTSS